MYPTINRQGSFGRAPVSYGPPHGMKPGQIPGYDLRVSYDIFYCLHNYNWKNVPSDNNDNKDLK